MLNKKIWVTGLFASLAVIIFVTFILHVLEKRTDDAAAKNVKTILSVTHASIDKWLEVNKQITAYYADTAYIRNEAQKLIKQKSQQKPLDQKSTRKWYQEIRRKYDYLGYFIINRDGINLASSRDANLNVPSLLLQDSGLIESVFSGNLVSSVPLKTDVPIQINGQVKDNVYSVFIVAPVYDDQKNVIAAFAFRINPASELSYFVDIASADNAVKVILINRQFKRIYLRSEYTPSESFNSEVESEVTRILQSENLLSDHPILLNRNIYQYLVGAVLWDNHLGVGLFTYLNHKDVHAAFDDATKAIILLAVAVVLLVWLALWGLDKSQSNIVNAKNWLENLLNSIPSIVCVVTKKGDLKFGNKNLHALEGFKNTIAGNKPLQINHGKLGDGCLQGSMLEYVWGPWCVKYTSPNGSEEIIDFEHIDIEDERGIPVDLVVANNVTEHMGMEVEKDKLLFQLQQSQKMEAIGQLTGGIAHDFNNMLSAMLGYTQLSLDYFAEDNQKLKEYLLEVNSAGLRAQQMVQQMLAFGRSDGKTSQNLDPVPVMKESIKLLKSTIPSSIELVEKITEQKADIFTDPVQLQQMIMNLVINSRDAINEKGIIVCSLESAYREKAVCSSCHEEFSGLYIAIAVQDSGEGMEDEKISRIFEPFYTSKDVGKGTGMGLAMVHGIIHSVGGHIIVNSKPGLGTEIVLLFPEIEMKRGYVGKKSA